MLSLVHGWHNDAKSAPIASPTKAQPAQAPYAMAQAEFAKGNWDKAAPLYKKHLRSFPTDFRAWNQLAASYYHSGQVKASLDTLQRIEKQTPDKSFNYFYQGMCIAVLGSEKEATRYWEYAAYWQDEFGAKATYELATSNYRSGDDMKARQWLSTYLQKFPRGPEAQSAKDLLKSLTENKKQDNVAGFDRPDPELTIYKYHPWSLFKLPHFWQVQLGGLNTESTGYEPVRAANGTGALVRPATSDLAMVVNASIGVGPIRQKSATSFAGYTYKQKWLMELPGILSWFDDGLSLDSFPLRGDMLERSHQFFGDMRRQMSANLFLGAYARLEFSRLGSSFFPSPDESSLKVVTPQTDTQLLIPWAGWSWSPTMRSMFSLYLRKEIHNQSPEHSNKTYDLTGATGDPAISLTLTHSMDFPQQRLETTIDIFQYEFIYNDYWLDYTRRGVVIGADYNIYKGIGASAILGYYSDDYKLPHIKTGGCGSDAPAADDATPGSCPRSDTGTMLQIGLYYNKSANMRIEGSYTMVENSSNLKVYSGGKNTYWLTATWAFPGTKRVSRMTERFADVAFTKDAEQ
jgi:tetratricopeptide (TPR) repeat protein